jgi:hypothetical protein
MVSKSVRSRRINAFLCTELNEKVKYQKQYQPAKAHQSLQYLNREM